MDADGHLPAEPALPAMDADGHFPAIPYARASLARKILRRRRAAGMTQAELARRAGIRPETMCRIEKGNVTPSVRTVEKIVCALESDLEEQGTENGF